MIHSERFFESNTGKTIYTQSWLPLNEQPQAVVVIVHGLGEHSGRYQNLLDALTPLSVAVYGLDHVGHGQSEGRRVFIEKFDQFVDNLDALVEYAKEQHPNLPVYIIGHSMGGLISTRYLIEHQQKLAGAILSAPAIQPPAQISPLLITLGKYVAALAPTLPVVALDIQGISRDPKVIAGYLSDDLVHSGKVTAGLSRQIQLAMDNVYHNASKIELPILVLQGSDDRLVNPKGARFLVEQVASADKGLYEYPSLYHELFNEPEKAKVLGDVIEWLQGQLTP